MAEALVRFTETIRGPDGGEYAAQACGGVADDKLWEGWIEFTAPNGSPIKTRRETEQPNRDALVYWAEGLTTAYLQGALRRALDAAAAQSAPSNVQSASVFSNPAAAPTAMPFVRQHGVLDPFATYMQGEGILRQQLSALSRDHLLALVDAYQLDVDSRQTFSKDALSEQIVHAVKRYSGSA